MLPIPFKNFIPKIFHGDPKTQNLSVKADAHLQEWKDDILNFSRMFRPDECDSKYLDELDELLSANLQPQDSDYLRRSKVARAVAGHKLRGTFNLDVKLRLDAITGYSSRILNESAETIFGSDDRILLSDGGVADAQAVGKYWSALGVDGVDDELGMAISGGEEVWVKVNIFIDIHEGVTTPVITSDVLDEIELALADVRPAYIFIYLGYVDGSDEFMLYRKLG